MNAPPFPLNPNIGDWWQNWVWNGARWVSSPTTGLRVITQVFTASGPYMPSPGLVSLTVECIGGGGGGGSAGPVADPSWILGGGGGGSGGYSRKTLPAALVRGGILVTLGGGGIGGATDPVPNPGDVVYGTGGAGAPTSFGALCIANGGGAGAGNNGNQISGQNGQGGNPAQPGTGDIAWPGAAGFNGAFLTVSGPANAVYSGGRGGWTMAGGVSVEAPDWNGQWANGANGADGTGAGGNGSLISQSGGGPLAGGTGGAGICIVTEQCWGDRDQPDIGWRPPLDVNVSFPKPPWPGGAPWPPGSWWPPGGWWGPGPWPPSSSRWPPASGVPGPRANEAVEYEAGQPYDQSINPETGLPWEDDT